MEFEVVFFISAFLEKKGKYREIRRKKPKKKTLNSKNPLNFFFYFFTACVVKIVKGPQKTHLLLKITPKSKFPTQKTSTSQHFFYDWNFSSLLIEIFIIRISSLGQKVKLTVKQRGGCGWNWRSSHSCYHIETKANSVRTKQKNSLNKI